MLVIKPTCVSLEEISRILAIMNTFHRSQTIDMKGMSTTSLHGRMVCTLKPFVQNTIKIENLKEVKMCYI